MRDAQLGADLPIGEPGDVDAERGRVFRFQLRLRPDQRDRSNELRDRAVRWLHDNAMFQP